jgi:hypothetical protein
LNRSHQTNVALGHAASMGSICASVEATSATVNMRDDNAADYPWLCFSLVTVMREYDLMRESGAEGPGRERIVAMLNGRRPIPGPSSASRQRRCRRATSSAPSLRILRRIGTICSRSSSAIGLRPTPFAHVLLLQFLPQRAQGHGDRRAPG